jgi:cytochrome bd-type quinol oxidase subunit 1
MVATKQPMKFAAFEGLYDGSHGVPLLAFGVVSNQPDTSKNYLPDIQVKIEVPNLLSYLAYLDPNAFVPGINDLINGNPKVGLLSAQEKIERGKIARNVLKSYKEAKEKKDVAVEEVAANRQRAVAKEVRRDRFRPARDIRGRRASPQYAAPTWRKAERRLGASCGAGPSGSCDARSSRRA